MGERKEFRTTVKLLACTVLAVLLLGPIGCSSASRQNAEMAGESQASTATAGTRSPAQIERIDLDDDGRRAAIELSADRPLVWTSFRNPEGDLVVELPNSVPASTVADISRNSGLVATVEVEHMDDTERPLTRLIVRTREPSEHSLMGEGQQLLLQLLPIDSAQEVTLAYEPIEEPVAEAVAEMPAPQPAAAPRPAMAAPGVPQTYGTPDAPQVGPAAVGAHAEQLFAVDVLQSNEATVVQVAGDGEFTYSTFRLQNPERFVIDLGGVVNTGARSSISVGSTLVDQIRIGQFKARPDPVSRVVFDLRDFSVPTISRSADGLVVTFGDSAGQIVAQPAIAQPATEQPTTLAQDMTSEERYSPEPESEEFVEPEPEPVEVVAAAEPVYEEAAPEPVYEEVESAPAYEEPAYEEPAVAEYSAPVPAYTPPPSAEPTAAAVPVYQPQAPSTAPAGGDVALFEAQQVEVPGGVNQRDRLLQSFSSLVVSRQEREYVGEPISMSLKNADLVETLRSFAKISDLNFVIQPGVRGSVTVELKAVPWDQAMEQILKINNLAMDIDGTIVRIAPRSQLRREADEARRLRQARQQSIPLRTVMRSLSYAKAQEVSSLLRSRTGAILSRRGSVQVDNRTNTLIIRELPDSIDTVLAIIDNLDTPEPQVTIEARIIEATKNFNRSLGVQWGFDFEATPEDGNTTGLQFPNTIDSDGGVGLLTGGANGFLNVTMGNILDTFRLNAALQVAESEGLVNIVSAPRITTLNNNSATIQSGLQIPIQTVSDRTVSVQFVNATLNLTVTPQVTAEGTILMDISVAKRSPQLAFAVVGASNAPIATKEARTKVIVRDGGTVVIGGIYEVQSNQNQDRVPGLANIPILGHLFKNRNRTDSNDELMIFITPRIVQL